MAQSIRAFIAVSVECPSELRPILRELNEMGRAVRAMSPDKLHLTLKFLGDVRLEQTASIANAISAAVGKSDAFRAELQGLGAFPHLGRPTVVWVGFANQGAIVELAEQIEAAIEPLGFSRERRPYHPHVTLARINSRPPETLRPLVEQHAATDIGTTGIDAVELFQSELGGNGPRYTSLARTELTH